MEHLKEANRYAQWSEQDRLSKLPTITPEQRQQIHDYLSIVQQHGLSKSIAAQEQSNDGGDVGNTNDVTTNSTCPVLSTNHHKVAPTAMTK